MVVLIGEVVISGVLLIPDLDVDLDLLSVAVFMAKGFGVTFEKGKAHIHKDNTSFQYPLRVQQSYHQQYQKFHATEHAEMQLVSYYLQNPY